MPIDAEREKNIKAFVNYWSTYPASNKMALAVEYLTYLLAQLGEERKKLVAVETQAQEWVSRTDKGNLRYQAAFETAGKEIHRILHPEEGE